MELDELKTYTQKQFTDGLVVIIGSGLSASVGLPTVPDIAAHLLQQMPAQCSAAHQTEWVRIAERLKAGSGDLEHALSETTANSPLLPLIVGLTASLVIEREQAAIDGILNAEIDFALPALLRHVVFAENACHVITSNYDRLIEFAAEAAGIGLDTGFTGANYGTLNPTQCRDALSTFVRVAKPPSIRRQLRTHVALHKPHGSVDWFLHNGVPVRSVVPIRAPRLMITPGTSKYRLGYNSPFDYHRTAANRAIDGATRFLIVGYGFNDDQLETHLRPKLAEGRPCILLTRALTPNARRLVDAHPSILALVEGELREQPGTTGFFDGQMQQYPNTTLWSLSGFLRGVLE